MTGQHLRRLLARPQPAICVQRKPIRRREGGGGEETAAGSATNEQGLRCLTGADQHVGAGTGMRRRNAAAAMARARGDECCRRWRLSSMSLEIFYILFFAHKRTRTDYALPIGWGSVKVLRTLKYRTHPHRHLAQLPRPLSLSRPNCSTSYPALHIVDSALTHPSPPPGAGRDARALALGSVQC